MKNIKNKFTSTVIAISLTFTLKFTVVIQNLNVNVSGVNQNVDIK